MCSCQFLHNEKTRNLFPSNTVGGMETRTVSRRLRCERIYNMNSLIEESGRQVVNLIVCCPFCAGPAHVIWQGLRPLLYGVRCRNCGASIPTTRTTAKEAISIWNRRSGLASRGGKATAGIRTPGKLSAARRNLEKARQVRQLNRLRASEETAYTTLQQFRQMERAELEAAMERDRTWMEERKDAILAHPTLRSMYEVLLSKSSAKASS